MTVGTLFNLDGFVDGARDSHGILWCRSTQREINQLLAAHHYLGARESGMLVFAGIDQEGEVVAAQTWGTPSSRRLPNDGTWLELARWCLTPAAGKNAGSRQHRYVTKWIRRNLPQVTTLLSYSDPSRGHTGALYRACNWEWHPTWHRLSPPPTGNGRWTSESSIESVKDRWIFPLRRDTQRESLLAVDADQAGRTLRKALRQDGLADWQRSTLERKLAQDAEQENA